MVMLICKLNMLCQQINTALPLRKSPILVPNQNHFFNFLIITTTAYFAFVILFPSYILMFLNIAPFDLKFELYLFIFNLLSRVNLIFLD